MMSDFDPTTMDLNMDYSDGLLRIKEHTIQVRTADGVFPMEAKWLMFNIHFWKPLVRRGLPIRKHHVFYKELLVPEVIARINSNTYEEVLAARNPDITYTEVAYPEPIPPVVHDPILYEFAQMITDVYVMISTKLGRYHRSISGFGLARLMCSDKFKELAKVDITNAKEIGVQAVEQEIQKASKRVLDALNDPTFENNCVYPFLKLGSISGPQLAQVMVAIGPRTDANDKLIRRPIMSSFFGGLLDAPEYAIESLAAKKSIFYNKHGMPDSQYENRKNQLQTSTIRHIYRFDPSPGTTVDGVGVKRGDCGTRLLVPYYVHEHNVMRMIGKYVTMSPNGYPHQLTRITRQNAKSFMDKTVYMRSAGGCRHTDGICKVCCGRMADYIQKDVTIGYQAAVKFGGPVSQQILSNKHYAFTKSFVYRVPPALKEALLVKRNDIFVDPKVDLSKVKLGIPFQCMYKVADLQVLEDSSAISEQHFSSIKSLIMVDKETGELLTPVVMMTDENGSTPHFSADALRYMKERYADLEIGETVWIPLDQFDKSKPLFMCVVENDSTMKFVNTVTEFLEKGLSKFRSYTEALKHFSDLVYPRISTNLMYLEVILKAAMVTDPPNYRVPVVQDLNNVRFGPLMRNIPGRALGSTMAFERHDAYLSEPTTFVVPREEDQFDPFLGMM